MLLLLGAATFQPFYWTILVRGRAEYGRRLSRIHEVRTPGLMAFAEGVRARTPKGARIVFAADARGFMRATYVLAGRTMLPGSDARLLLECDYVAAYRREVHVPGFVEIWRSRDGVLLRRVR